MSYLLLFIIIFLITPAYGQDVPVSQKSASRNEMLIDFYGAYQNRAPILLSSQFAEDIEFIPLETTDECLLGDFLANIIVTSDNIIVFDYESCYRFDRKGKFMNKIGSKGNGPGEYTNPTSIMVDTLNQWVYFSDYWSARLVKYDYTGKHLTDLKIEGIESYNTLYKPKEFILERSGYHYAKKGERFSLLYYSEEQNKIISKMRCDYENEIPKLVICPPISYTYQGNLFVKDFWCDTIYQMIDPLHLKSYAVLDKGKFENRKYDDNSLITGKEEARDRMVLVTYRITETGRYILISSNKAAVVYDKKLKKTFAGGYLGENGKLGVQDDLYGSPGIRSDYFPKGVIDNRLCSFRQAHELIENGDGGHKITDARYEAYQKMVKNLKEDDNPVIMIFKIKK